MDREGRPAKRRRLTAGSICRLVKVPVMDLLSVFNPLSSVLDSVVSALHLPKEIGNVAKVVVGVVTENPVMAVEGGAGLLGNIVDAAAKTEYHPPPWLEPPGWGPPFGGPPFGGPMAAGRAPVCFIPDSPLDPNVVQYRSALETLLANFRTLDTAGGSEDGLISQKGLLSVANNPHASSQMKEAAHFLLDNPEYFNRLESSAALFGALDGKISRNDILKELGEVNWEIARFGVPFDRLALSDSSSEECIGSSATSSRSKSSSSKGSSSKSSKSSSRSTDIQKILKDSSLSLEEKVQQVLEAVLKKVDKDVQDTMGELDDAESKSKKSGDDSSAADVDSLTRKLQLLMERRQQMTELVSNMSRTFSDMALSAIRNMRS